MPSPFESMFSKQLAGAVYHTFALDALYTSPGGTSTAVSVRVQRGDVRQEPNENGVVSEVQTAFVHALQADIPLIEKGGRFRVESVEVWTVALPPVLKNGQFTCQCERRGVGAVMTRRAKDA